RTIKIWTEKEGGGYNHETLEGHAGPVYTLQVLPDGRIVSGSWDTIKIWTKNGEGIYNQETLKGHIGLVRTLQVLPDGRIVSGGMDNTIKIWDGNKIME
ncbi:MAG: serine/threonine protein kinase, partial [Patescibacteria group bacterium]